MWKGMEEKNKEGVWGGTLTLRAICRAVWRRAIVEASHNIVGS